MKKLLILTTLFLSTILLISCGDLFAGLFARGVHFDEFCFGTCIYN